MSSSGDKVKSVSRKEATNIIDTNLVENGDRSTTLYSSVGYESIMDWQNPDAKFNIVEAPKDVPDKKSKRAKGNDIKIPYPEIIPSIPPTSIPDEVVDYSSSDDDKKLKKPKPSSSNNARHPGAIHVAGRRMGENNIEQQGISSSRNGFSGDVDRNATTALAAQTTTQSPIVAKIVEDDLEDRAMELENEKNELAQELARYNDMPVITGEVQQEESLNKLQTRLCNRYIFVAFFTLAIGGIIAGITLSTTSSEGDDEIDRRDYLIDLIGSISNETAINDKYSHQYMAFNWVLEQYNSSYSDTETIQAYTLSLLYFSTEGGRWANQYEFLTEFDVCGWNNNNSINCGGVICNPDGVREIYLSTNNLNGTVPSEIGNLRNLKVLDFENNDLTGTIPTEVGDLRNLKNLTLSDNKLTGTIPQELGNCEILYYLHMANNNLIGTIPPELGNIGVLWSLHLQKNDLSGIIPPMLGNYVKLIDMYLNDNNLTGTIPSTFDNFERVESINVTNNELTGDIYFLCDIEKNTSVYADCSAFSPPGCSCSSCDCCQPKCYSI